MNNVIIFRRFWFALCFSLILFMQSTNAFARPEIGGPEGPRRGPEDITIGGERYRYHDGRFYRPIFFGLFGILVDVPPIGAIVTVLPVRHKTIVTGGRTYYYYDDVYYTVCPSGYIVVPAPAATTLVATPVALAPQKAPTETVTINVPNSSGSYTPITLVKQKDGYVGPQGEYYLGHPTVEQLKALYGN